MSGQAYAVGTFLLDARLRLLMREGKPVPLTPKAVDTLLVLVRNAGRLVGYASRR
jgi:DNA-binding winged helix-turn-helix (wHTH) protein